MLCHRLSFDQLSCGLTLAARQTFYGRIDCPSDAGLGSTHDPSPERTTDHKQADEEHARA